MKQPAGILPFSLTILALTVGLAVAAETNSAPLRTGKLSLGWASTDITPPQPVALCGQFVLRLSKRVNDPLTTTALAIETRDAKGVIDHAVIVSADVIGIRGVDLERIRTLVGSRAPGLDPEKIVLCATHTHSAPVLVDAREQSSDPHDLMARVAYRVPEKGYMQPADYIRFFATRVADAVVEAWNNRRPGGVSWSFGHAVVGQNRRIRYLDGRAQMYGPVNKPDFDSFESTTDSGVEMLFLWDANHKLTGTIVNLACPAQEVGTSDYVSADFWHDAREELRQRHGAKFFILPLCGAAGDISPNLNFRTKAEAALRRRQGNLTPRQEIGKRIAVTVNSGLELSRNEIHFEVPFLHTRQMMSLPVRRVTKAESEAARKTCAEVEAQGLDAPNGYNYLWRLIQTNTIARFETQDQRPFAKSEVHFMRLGDIAIATNPFELFVDFGLRMKARSPAEQTFVVQLACDCQGYVPTERAVGGGHYSAEIMSNLIGPKGGQMLVDQTVEALKGMWPAAQ